MMWCRRQKVGHGIGFIGISIVTLTRIIYSLSTLNNLSISFNITWLALDITYLAINTKARSLESVKISTYNKNHMDGS